MTPFSIGLGVGLLLWGALVGMALEDRLLAWYVRRCQGSWPVAVAVCLALGLAVVAVAVVTAAGMQAASGADPDWGPAWVYVPVALLGTPLLMVLLPTSTRWTLPGDLRRAGATPPVVRATCAAVFPVAFLGLALLCLGFFTAFPVD